MKRPRIYAFRDALIEIGVEESDARRLARATGRSWSVYRRRRATNPAIRSPEWLGHAEPMPWQPFACSAPAWRKGR